MSPARCRDGTPCVLALDEATDPGLAGAKAAALARAAAAGLPVLPGFVVTPPAAADLASSGGSGEVESAVRAAYSALSDGGRGAVAVRSSSTVEDATEHSMAGQFTSVIGVRGWDAFRDAVARVVASAVRGPSGGEMAVLVQPHVQPARGGVVFGADPVHGRTDRLLVAAVEGGPDALVSGEVDAAHVSLTPRGRVVDGPVAALGGAQAAAALADLARRAARVFGQPQDIEWAVHDGELLLLQSRPITAMGAVGRGPVLGPGPIAETFPAPLRALERDMWLAPMRDALREVFTITGAVSRRRLGESPVVVAVRGRVAADLELLGVEPRPRSRRLLDRVDPRVAVRQLTHAWRAGRVQAALPALARDLVAEVDARLAEVPPLGELSDTELLTLLERARELLVSVHGHEVLAARLLGAGDAGNSAAAVALQILADRRDSDGDDAALVARHPVLLALSAPSIAEPPPLPHVRAHLPATSRAESDTAAQREALRLRARWIHELTARAARELGGRLAAAGLLDGATSIADVTLAQLADAVAGRIGPLRPAPFEPGPPLPARFRLAADGSVIALTDGARHEGTGAGGGRGAGMVTPADALPAPGAVLVVRNLDPALASLLPGLAGLVAETGSVLAHLAILAREMGVPVVVSVPDAVRRFPPGTSVVVDGLTGAVTVQDERP